MPVQFKKLHPALKHAGYASTSVLPGEDKPAFEKLNRDLIAEFSPNGALENDIVTTMAHLLWRKKNLATFRIAELAQDRCRQIRDEKYTWIEEDPLCSLESALSRLIPLYGMQQFEQQKTRPAKSWEKSTSWKKLAKQRRLIT
jgi:hypothetical protein